MSSHILFEVEQLTRSILLIHRGRLMASGDLTVIRSLIDKHPHQVRIGTPDAHGLAAALSALPNVVSLAFESGATHDSEGLRIEVRDPDGFYDALARMTEEGSYYRELLLLPRQQS